MLRFTVRLAVALLVEELLRDKRKPTYFHGLRIHPRNIIPTDGSKYTLTLDSTATSHTIWPPEAYGRGTNATVTYH